MIACIVCIGNINSHSVLTHALFYRKLSDKKRNVGSRMSSNYIHLYKRILEIIISIFDYSYLV